MYICMAFPIKPTKHYPPNNGEWKKNEEVITAWRLHWKKWKNEKKMENEKKWKEWKNEKMKQKN